MYKRQVYAHYKVFVTELQAFLTFSSIFDTLGRVWRAFRHTKTPFPSASAEKNGALIVFTAQAAQPKLLGGQLLVGLETALRVFLVDLVSFLSLGREQLRQRGVANLAADEVLIAFGRILAVHDQRILALLGELQMCIRDSRRAIKT